MTREERQNWIINIENSASFIVSEIGEEVVNSTLFRFGTSSIEGISDAELPDVFGELYTIETDLRSG